MTPASGILAGRSDLATSVENDSIRLIVAGHFTREILAERVRFELTGLSSSGFQGRTGAVAGVRQRSI